jgi:universal stress protein E
MVKSAGPFLVVVDRSHAAAEALGKAAQLARVCGASLELFMSDAECAFALAHAYDPAGVEEARRACIEDANRYLQELQDDGALGVVPAVREAVCDSPLYESIVRKVIRSHARVVIKNAAGTHRRPFTPDPNDWQLMRTCPATLLLTRGKPWPTRPRLAVAVDASEEDPAFMREVMGAAQALCDREEGFDVLYAEPPGTSAAQHRSAERALQGLMREMKLDGSRLHVLEGRPESELPAFARPRNYDVLLLGALTHRPDLTCQVGTLTASLIEALDCDFILVKPHEYRSPISDCSTRVGRAAEDTPARESV